MALAGITFGSNLPDLFRAATAYLRSSVEQGAFPGAAFGVSLGGKVLANRAVGRFTFDPASPLVLPGTLFDLASVTKVAATTAMAMLLFERDLLPLDTSVGSILPEVRAGRVGDEWSEQITLRMLLSHSSGLPAYAPLYQSCADRQALLRAVCALPLEAAPGARVAYSDPGFILLGMALERLAGEPLESFCEREIFDLLAMRQTCWNPAAAMRAAIPPTERKQQAGESLQGRVHDENCAALGGVSGHAGLFAPALDLLRFAEAMLAPLRPNAHGPTLFSRETVQLFTNRSCSPAGSSRALGWDTPSGEVSSSGSHFHATSFGHLGFTGTSLWIDPERDLAVVLLTNRTFPSRENKAIQGVRPRFHDLIVEALPHAFQNGTAAWSPVRKVSQGQANSPFEGIQSLPRR